MSVRLLLGFLIALAALVLGPHGSADIGATTPSGRAVAYAYDSASYDYARDNPRSLDARPGRSSASPGYDPARNLSRRDVRRSAGFVAGEAVAGFGKDFGDGLYNQAAGAVRGGLENERACGPLSGRGDSGACKEANSLKPPSKGDIVNVFRGRPGEVAAKLLVTVGVFKTPFGRAATPSARVAASVDDVSRSAASSYSAASPDLSRAGQSLSKHQRRGGPYPQATGRPEAVSRQAQDVVDEVLTNPQSSFTTRQSGRFGEVVDVQVPGGAGVRYSEGKGFLHFLEPPR